MLSFEQVLNKMKSLEEINKKLSKENKQISDWMDNDSNTIEDLTAQLETAQKKINASEQVFMSSLILYRLLFLRNTQSGIYLPSDCLYILLLEYLLTLYYLTSCWVHKFFCFWDSKNKGNIFWRLRINWLNSWQLFFVNIL